MQRPRRDSTPRCHRPRARGRRGGGRCRAPANRSVMVAWPLEKRRNGVGRHALAWTPMGLIRFGPARVPSRESPEAAVELLLERGYSACEIDFESGFWMDYPWAERFGEVAREAGIVLSVHAPLF